MINENKVAVMTRMAAYEAGDGKKNQTVCSYFRGDYVGFQMLKTWIAVTIAFCIMSGVYLLFQMDSIMTDFYSIDLIAFAKKFVFAYVILCVVYLFAAFVIAQRRYGLAQRATVRFGKELEELDGRADGDSEEEE
nr:hypothetical protein [uncultured Eisenbergiella sp.]